MVSEAVAQGFGDAGVQRASWLAQQRAVGRILHEGVLEQIGCVRRHTLPKQQTCRHETVERRLEFRLRLASHRSQQSMRELSPNGRSDLRYLLGGAEPIKPRHQRGVQACGDGKSRGGNGGGGLPRVAFDFPASNTALVISSTNNGMPSVRSMMSCVMLFRQRLVARDAVDHGSDFALPKPVEGECSYVRLPNPRRLKLWSVRNDQQDAKSSYSVQRRDRALPGSWGRSNARPRKSSALDWTATAPPVAQ